jgi:hypothetical protein
MNLLDDLLKADGHWSARQISLVGVALAYPIAGACMCAGFMIRAIHDQPLGYVAFGSGLAILGAGVGLSAALHLAPTIIRDKK